MRQTLISTTTTLIALTTTALAGFEPGEQIPDPHRLPYKGEQNDNQAWIAIASLLGSIFMVVACCYFCCNRETNNNDNNTQRLFSASQGAIVPNEFVIHIEPPEQPSRLL